MFIKTFNLVAKKNCNELSSVSAQFCISQRCFDTTIYASFSSIIDYLDNSLLDFICQQLNENVFIKIIVKKQQILDFAS
jgi:hypothetical protein